MDECFLFCVSLQTETFLTEILGLEERKKKKRIHTYRGVVTGRKRRGFGDKIHLRNIQCLEFKKICHISTKLLIFKSPYKLACVKTVCIKTTTCIHINVKLYLFQFFNVYNPIFISENFSYYTTRRI